jgi:putative membrane protein
MDQKQVTTLLLVIVGAVLLLPVLGMSFWGFGMMGQGMMGPGMMARGGYAGFGVLTMVLLLGGLALIVWALTRGQKSSETPLEILKTRLAKGEISKEQYEGLKEALR